MEHHNDIIIESITEEDIALLVDILNNTKVSVSEHEKFITLYTLREKLTSTLSEIQGI